MKNHGTWEDKMMLKMYCLPYAGGSASTYNDWISRLIQTIEVCPMEYAGHGNRFCDEFFKTIEEVAEDISEDIEKQCKSDYIIYGHSMGCLVALETAFILEKKNAPLPKAIIVAATRPPHLMYKDKLLENLSKDELMKEIASLGQMEPEVFEYPELYELVSDIMYADIQMLSSYKRRPENGKIHIPVLALTGLKDDEAPPEDMEEWKLYVESDFELHTFEGDHFFAFNDNDKFMEYITQYIEKLK